MFALLIFIFPSPPLPLKGIIGNIQSIRMKIPPNISAFFSKTWLADWPITYLGPPSIWVFFIVLYVAAPFAVSPIPEKIIFHGNINEFDQLAVSGDDFFLETNGGKLQGWFVDRPITEEKPLLLYFGGLTQDVAFVPLLLSKMFDNAILSFNYRNYGLSEGEPSEEARLADASYIVDQYLATKGIQKKDEKLKVIPHCQQRVRGRGQIYSKNAIRLSTVDVTK